MQVLSKIKGANIYSISKTHVWWYNEWEVNAEYLKYTVKCVNIRFLFVIQCCPTYQLR